MKKILAAILVVSFLIRAAYSFLPPVKGWDETVYANLGWNLKSDPTNYKFELWGDKNPTMWESAGFRPPLLPYILAAYYTVFGSNYFLINFIMPLVGTLGIFFTYLLGKEMFNKNVGVYSAAFMAFLPLHVIISGKILNDIMVTTLITLTALFFWLGFEKNRNRYKILFGVALGLSVLAKYTAIMMVFVFLIYMLTKNRNLKFAKDKWTLLSMISLFAVISPWLIYSYLEYGNPIGALMHAQSAAFYWGTGQPWYLSSMEVLSISSILVVTLAIGLATNALKIKKPKINSRHLLLSFWLMTFFIILFAPDKEGRFLLTLTPPLVILPAFVFSRMSGINKFLISAIVSIFFAALIVSDISGQMTNNSSTNAKCFLDSMSYLKNTENNSIIFTESSPIVFYYTRKENHFITEGNVTELIKGFYQNRTAYLLLSNFDHTLQIVNDNNFRTVFACPSYDNPEAVILKHGR